MRGIELRDSVLVEAEAAGAPGHTTRCGAHEEAFGRCDFPPALRRGRKHRGLQRRQAWPLLESTGQTCSLRSVASGKKRIKYKPGSVASAGATPATEPATMPVAMPKAPPAAPTVIAFSSAGLGLEKQIVHSKQAEELRVSCFASWCWICSSC